jgi:aspartate/glutamate racemase
MCDKVSLDFKDPRLMAKVAVEKNNAVVTGSVSAEGYAKYQKRVSEILPVEEQRPSAVVKLGPSESDSPIVLIGGMGPLSDASILLKVLKMLKALKAPKRASITLYSFPPPRKDPSAFFDHLVCLKALTQSHGGGKCFLLSNTAHVMFELFDQVVFARSPLQLVHLVDIAARRVSAASGSHDALVLLTTLVSWRAGLYESRITGFKKVVRCGSADAKEIQRAVDLAKMGDGAGKELLMRYLDTAMAKLAGRRVVVFLGCTDFVFLGEGLSAEIAERYGATVMDTDAMFAEDIANHHDKRVAVRDDRDGAFAIAVAVLALVTVAFGAMRR